MSPNTRWPLISALVVALFALPAAAGDVAPPLAPAAAALAPNVKARGGGSLTFLGIHIYDGYYYAPPSMAAGWSISDPFAMQLVYRRHLVGQKIADRSVEEIAKMGYGTREQRTLWGDAMRRIFPDVNAGDHLTGVNVPQQGVRYFYNGKAIGAIDDPEFAKAFFAMWLDPRTSEPELRRKLLGEAR
jgi:Chalcone isomerase-like